MISRTKGKTGRRLALGLTVLAVALVAVHSAAWFWATARMQSELEAARPGLEAAGLQVRHGAPVRTGWPLAAGLMLPDVRVSALPLASSAAVPGGVAWRAERVLLEVRLLQPTTLRILPAGQQALGFAPDAELGFTADDMVAEAPLMSPGPVQMSAGLLRVTRPFDLTVARTRADLDGRRLRAEWTRISLPAGPAWALGRDVAGVTLDAAVSPAPRVLGTPEASLAAWRDAGGTLSVTNLALLWGPLDLAGSATVTLDQGLQPAAQGSMRVKGAPETLTALRAAGVLTSGQVLAANAMLSLLVQPGAEASGVALPFSVRDGTVSVGNIPIMRVGPLLEGVIPGRHPSR